MEPSTENRQPRRPASPPSDRSPDSTPSKATLQCRRWPHEKEEETPVRNKSVNFAAPNSPLNEIRHYVKGSRLSSISKTPENGRPSDSDSEVEDRLESGRPSNADNEVEEDTHDSASNLRRKVDEPQDNRRPLNVNNKTDDIQENDRTSNSDSKADDCSENDRLLNANNKADNIQQNDRPSKFARKPNDTACLTLPHAKHVNRLSTIAETLKVYIVVQSQASQLATRIWDQISHTIKGVYESEKDANNRVLSMYREAVADRLFVGHGIMFWNKSEGSPYCHWETTGKVIDDCHVRVHVEKWDVSAERNEEAKWHSLVVG